MYQIRGNIMFDWDFTKAEVKADLAAYFKAMLDNDLDKLISIEQKYDVYGLPPEMVTSTLSDYIGE